MTSQSIYHSQICILNCKISSLHMNLFRLNGPSLSFYVIEEIIIDLLKHYLNLGKAILIFLAMCWYIVCSKSPFVVAWIYLTIKDNWFYLKALAISSPLFLKIRLMENWTKFYPKKDNECNGKLNYSLIKIHFFTNIPNFP